MMMAMPTCMAWWLYMISRNDARSLSVSTWSDVDGNKDSGSWGSQRGQKTIMVFPTWGKQ